MSCTMPVARTAVSLRRWLVAGLVAALVTACGGGTDGNAPAQQRQVNAVSTRLAAVPAGFDIGELRVFGVSGLARIANYLSVPDAAVGKLDQLTGPYAVSYRVTSATDSQSYYLGTITFGRGEVNLSPLTTLAVTQANGLEPNRFFGTLGVSGDERLQAFTPEVLAAAQQAVERYLQRRLGIAVPASLGDFFTGAFRDEPGDPMHDLIAAIEAKLAAQGRDFFALAADVAQESTLCSAEQLALTSAGQADVFCPATKATVPDGADPTVSAYVFTTASGAVLTLRARGSDLLSASYRATADGTESVCAAAGCAGIVLGALAADGSRPIVFTGARLDGAAGPIELDGSLLAPKPGPVFPPLSCPDRYFIVWPDDSLQAACAAPDNTLSVGVGDASSAGGDRRGYLFRSDGSVEPVAANLEVRAEGEAVTSVFVQDTDAATGLPRTLFKCVGAACAGVTIGPARDDADSFAPYVLRRRLLTLQDTELAALNPDGTPSALGPATVRATLDSFELIVPEGAPPVFSPIDPCASPTEGLVATAPYGTFDVCPPSLDPNPDTGNRFVDTTLDAGGNPVYSLGYGSLGTFPPDGGVTIETAGGTISRVTFREARAGTWRCTGAACSGITIPPPDGSGARRIVFDGVVLQEVESADLPGDRSLRLDGAFTAPPPRTP